MPRITLHEVLAAEPETVEDVPAVLKSLAEPITHRPDGWYWQTVDGRQEFGPFASQEDALADMRGGDPEDLAPGETLQEAESEIGSARRRRTWPSARNPRERMPSPWTARKRTSASPTGSTRIPASRPKAFRTLISRGIDPGQALHRRD
jgi:hypothetical protein